MKAANSYASLLRGVSQQVPQERAEGQHGEQINMLSDPVNGLTRRHGSQRLAEALVPGALSAQLAAYVTDTANFNTYDFAAGGAKYSVLYRTKARPASANPLPLCTVYNKSTKAFLPVVRPVVDASLDLLESGGVSALTAVGRYLFFAGNSLASSGTDTARWDTATNFGRAVIWIRGGAYSRVYSVKVRLQAGTVFTASYTTPSSSYQGVLDTSSILTADPDYTKKVNDMVNAHNGLVTNWIGTSTAAIQPAAIAAQLAAALTTAGVTNTLVGSHICFTAGTVKSVEVDDGGDGTLIRGVADEIASVDQVSVVHYVGKVVKVRSRNATEAFYLKAIAKDTQVTSGYTEVTWVEGAGVEHAITGGLIYGTVSGGTFYIASSAALLTTLLAGTHPTFTVSGAGDNDSAPSPYFVGKKITYLGNFQNRLLVGSGGVLSVSKTEDFLNFFRSTVLTLPANDPFDMLAQGSESDTLLRSTLYDQDLVIFGQERQYVVTGNVALTPTSANMPVMSNYQGVADAGPVGAGGFVFYAKRSAGVSSVHQIQPGQTQNSPESFPASSQLDDYISGGIVEMVSFTGSPSMLAARTDASRNSVYVFAYLDKQDGRKMDSWSRWDFSEVLGSVSGLTSASDGFIVFTLRVSGAGAVYIVADLCPISTKLSDTPYLDSWRVLADVTLGTGSVTTASPSGWYAAFDSTSGRRFTGSALANLTTLQTNYPGEPGLVVGALQEALFEPTNPFMRDGKEQAILSGRLTIGLLTVAFKDSTGFDWTLVYRDSVTTGVTFNGRILGDPLNIIGVEPITTGQHTIPVGRETRRYSLTIKGRKWYPLTVTALEWAGQFFNRTQRF